MEIAALLPVAAAHSAQAALLWAADFSTATDSDGHGFGNVHVRNTFNRALWRKAD